MLLLEVLSDGEPGDALHGCRAGHAELVVDRIAQFHARWWDRPDLDRLKWLPPWGGDPDARAERYRGQGGPVLERYGDRIPQQVRDLAVRLTGRYADILRYLANGSATMIHADLHLDNVIFTPETGQQSAKIIDWQSVSRGTGAIDLALFIVGSLDVTERRRVEQGLLERYHQTLVTDGVTGYSFEQLLHDYRLALLWQLAGTVGWLSRVDLEALEGRERELVGSIFSKGQLFAALQDHEVPV